MSRVLNGFSNLAEINDRSPTNHFPVYLHMQACWSCCHWENNKEWCSVSNETTGTNLTQNQIHRLVGRHRHSPLTWFFIIYPLLDMWGQQDFTLSLSPRSSCHRNWGFSSLYYDLHSKCAAFRVMCWIGERFSFGINRRMGLKEASINSPETLEFWQVFTISALGCKPQYSYAPLRWPTDECYIQ